MAKRITGIFLALVLTFSSLVGCASKDAQNSTPNSTPDSTQSSSASGESGKQVTIRFMDNMASATRDAAYAEIIQKFNEQNPNIKVEYETVPWDQSHSKLVTLGSTKSLPDVIQVHPTWISEFVNAGWIVPLGKNLETYEFADNFTDYTKKVLLDQTQKKVYNDIFVIPDAILTNGMFVRKDWFEAKKLDYQNWTWNDFFNDAALLTNPAENRYAFSFRGARGAFHQSQFFLYSVTDGRVYDESGTCLLNSPECVEIFTKYINLYKNSYTPKDAINWGFSEMVQGFTSGLTGMLNQTCEVIDMCEQSALTDDQWTVAPLPKSNMNGKVNNEISFSNGYAIAANSANQEAAWKFVAFLSSPEAAAVYGKANLLIPVMKDALNDEFYSTGKMAGYAEMFKDPNLVAWPELGYFSQIGEFRETFADAEVQKCMLGKQTPQETLDNIANYLTKYQQQYMKENPEVPVPMPKDTSTL